MVRKLLIPLLAAVALSGCVSDYYYRGGSGDYYYGSPATSIYYGAPYSSIGYGYGGSWYGDVRYRYGYGGYPGWGYPYGYYGPGYGFGYFPYYPRPYHHHRPPPRPGETDTPETGERLTGGRQPPRRRMAPPAQAAQAMPYPIRRNDGQPLMRSPRVQQGMPERQVQRQPSRPLAPPRADSRPMPRMEAPAPRATPMPRMERREAPPMRVRQQEE